MFRSRRQLGRDGPIRGLVTGDIDAPFMEQVLHVSHRERETDVHHHGQADDLGRSLEIFERITHPVRLGNYAPALTGEVALTRPRARNIIAIRISASTFDGPVNA
jgi:hypothetical protein